MLFCIAAETLRPLGHPVDVGKLQCGHAYCFSCIDKWSHTTTHCCLCKQPFRHIDQYVWTWAFEDDGRSENGASKR